MRRKIIYGLAGLLLAQAVSSQVVMPARQRILLDADWRLQANALPRLMNGGAITHLHMAYLKYGPQELPIADLLSQALQEAK